MVFSVTLLAAARQDSRSQRVSIWVLLVLLASAMLTPVAAEEWAATAAVILTAICVYRAGLCGAADPIGIAALTLRHGSGLPLGWIGAGYLLTALGARLTGEPRPPLFPGLLAAHVLILGSGVL